MCIAQGNNVQAVFLRNWAWMRKAVSCSVATLHCWYFFFPLIRSSAAPGFFCNVPVSWLKNASKTPNENMRCGRLSDLWTVFWAFWSWFLLYRCNRSANQVLHSCGLLFPTFFTSGVFGQQEMSSYSCWLGENVWHPGWCGWSVQPNNKQLTEKERITRHNFYTSSSMSH